LLAHYSEDPNLLAAFDEEHGNNVSTNDDLKTKRESKRVNEARQESLLHFHLSPEPIMKAARKSRSEGNDFETDENDDEEEETEAPEASAKPEDFFRRLARQWRSIPWDEEVSEKDRSAAKALCYGIVYGAGESLIADSLKTSLQEARKLLHDFKRQSVLFLCWDTERFSVSS
jgi:DNA polymerase I-like protein with 3'-5' exonuclease and polymerase domains